MSRADLEQSWGRLGVIPNGLAGLEPSQARCVARLGSILEGLGSHCGIILLEPWRLGLLSLASWRPFWLHVGRQGLRFDHLWEPFGNLLEPFGCPLGFIWPPFGPSWILGGPRRLCWTPFCRYWHHPILVQYK